jgi:hypothetical protein
MITQRQWSKFRLLENPVVLQSNKIRVLRARSVFSHIVEQFVVFLVCLDFANGATYFLCMT